MHFTVETWDEFKEQWGGVINFLMDGEMAAFRFDLPPLADALDQLRRSPNTRIYKGEKSPSFIHEDISEDFRALPIEEALESPFNIANFELDEFYGPGRLFHRLEESWVEPWRRSLEQNGFTYRECFPIVFVSGRNCATNYHLDYSHVMAWQRYGTKLFYGLKDPDRWTTPEQRLRCELNMTKPTEIIEDDILCYEMPPGSVLWNAISTPHWVDAADEVALTMSMVHRGLRLNGKLCPHEEDNRILSKKLEEESKELSSVKKEI